MAAHLQPNNEQIENVVNLTGVSREEAIQRLKGNNNNVEQAIGEFFDSDGSSNKYRWDEAAFNNDQDGIPSNHGIAFDIHAPDDPGPYGPRFDGAGAPSRPPSRTSNNKSPLSKIIDLTVEHAAADPSMSIGFDHDSELQQALAASRAEAGMSPQETGVTGTDQVYFGPATRPQNEYDSGQWGLVPLGKSAIQDEFLDPEPAQRVRAADAPAFLKPSKNHRLGALITIYHEIPVTRNLFMNAQDTDIHFGYDKEWWTGKQIELPNLSPEDEQTHFTVDREFQRLMAFLDKTERSYGSVEALANHPEVVRAHRRKSDQSIEAAVLDSWRRKFDPNKLALTRQIFSTGVDSEREENAQDFAILELILPMTGSMQETFYDMADEILWPNFGPTDISDSPYLSRIAEVIAFQVEGSDDRKRVEIPLVWYPDRYLKPARQAALDMRLHKREVQEELERIDKLEDQLTHIPLRTGKIVKVQDLLNASLKHDNYEVKRDVSELDDDMLSERRPSPAATKLSSELRKLVASIDKKLIALNEEKEKARQTFRELSKLYTEPTSEPDSPKLHKYTLRGVSTSMNTMFICRRAEPDLIDMDVDGDEPSGPKDQWWMINYANEGYNPVTVEKTTTERVLEEARYETSNTLLVYASEKAMNHPIQALPKALESFVKWENTNFKSEFRTVEDIQTDTQTIIDDSQPVGLSSPGKRKFHESSLYNQDYGVKISEREVRTSDGSPDWDAGPSNDSFAPNGKQEVIMGIDPSLLTKDHNDHEAGQEMQERSSMPMLSGRPLTKEKASTIDSMDLDQVVEDMNVKEESAAVKHVGFVE
ncbi:uncharacterized protein LY89DRAFT_786579 [Mollisia scopiformis]|uniref:UBA domain-containing protein n=1 Tax=Mollisia scopiformis TaxID=149040 RepID=A0A194WUQ8_MOLSC|nr:uncharacterized protein LY89DRAFT_786579 [Mollisia scopiformis]KUJ11698.1 hypothetical protein LY89DRAFT_786579 [Mollisia scopiformis]